MSDWLQYQLLQEREMWERDEAAQAEYQSWLDTINELKEKVHEMG